MRREVIKLSGLSIGYKEKHHNKIVAKDISTSINSGELTCLLGSNGVGKSTLLRTISAFQPKLFGDIFIEGKEITQYTESELSTIISVVLTDKVDVKNMTATELIGLGRSPYTGFWGRLNDADNRAIQKAIQQVRISQLADRMIHSLSDGERQKTVIAKALAQETPIIILDEPTAFLDFPSKVDIMQLLHRLTRESDKTIFLSTHDLELALQIADKIWLMDDEKRIHTGTPEDLALSGVLSGFFEEKEIIFDRHTGLFRIENDYDRVVKVLGHGYKFSMIRKALLRNRILADRNAQSEEYIDTTNEVMTLHKADKTIMQCGTIEELLQELL